MSVPSPTLQSQDLVMIGMQPQYGSAQEHIVRSFKDATGVTVNGFSHAQVTAALNGCMVIPENGRAANQERFVESVTGTAVVVDVPWFDVTGSTTFRAWQLGEVPAVVTTASSAAVIASSHASIAAEPDGTWVGWQLVGETGANKGKAFTVTAFTSSTGTFTATGLTLTVLGDKFTLRRQLRLAEAITATVESGTGQRTVIGTGSRAGDMPMLLANKGAITTTLEQRPLATAGASGIQAVAPGELRTPLRGFFTETADTGGTVTSIDANGWVAGGGGLFSVNGVGLFHNGKVAQVLSTSTGAASATVTKYAAGQAGFATVSAGSVVNAGVTWTRKDSDFMHYVLEAYRGGKLFQYFGGCMPSLSIMLDRQAAAKFAFTWSVSDGFERKKDRPVALGAVNALGGLDAGAPNSGQGARVVIDGINVTVKSINVNVGLVPGANESLNGVNQNDGCVMDFVHPTFDIVIDAAQDDVSTTMAVRDRMRSNRPFTFLYQRETAGGRTFWLASPSMVYTGGTFGYGGTPAQGLYTMKAACIDPALAVDYDNVLMYPVATYPGLRELAFGLV